jgi:hypothetical protein
MENLYTHNMPTGQFLEFSDHFTILLPLSDGVTKIQVWVISDETLHVPSISRIWAQLEHVLIFGHCLIWHAVYVRVNLQNCAENHLSIRKEKITSENLEIPRKHCICILVNVKIIEKIPYLTLKKLGVPNLASKFEIFPIWHWKNLVFPI